MEEKKSKLIVEGRVFEIYDLGQPMNEAFRQLFSSFFSSPVLNFEEFEKATLVFFDSVENDGTLSKLQKASSHDKFFSNFTIMWQWFWNQRRLSDAEYLWELAVKPALDWETKNKNCLIHKGTAFYFWGGTAILNGNLDKGYLLMHQALAEDKRKHSDPTTLPDTPSFVFVTLDYTDPRNTFKEWTLERVKFLEELLNKYQSTYSKHITSEELRSRLLRGHRDISLIILFAYTLARFYNLEKTPPYAQESDFAGQLDTNMLFDIAVIIEALIKTKSGIRCCFKQQAKYFSDRTSLGFSDRPIDQLREVNTYFENDFDLTLRQLLDAPFRFCDSSTVSIPGGRDLAIAYGIRNHGAHNISSVPAIWERFTDLRQSLFNVLFLCIETLYP
ncbi:hypothetical protein GX441_01790 [bacterium]|nr:hypothetical protein [bacterium]